MRLISWMLVLGLAIAGCAGGDDSSTEGAEGAEASSGDEATEASGGDEATESSLEGTTTEATNPFAIPEDASEALQQAEWLRSEQVRGFRMLEMKLERDEISCEDAGTVATDLCGVSDRICDQVSADRAASAQCNDSMDRCGAGRALVRDRCD